MSRTSFVYFAMLGSLVTVDASPALGQSARYDVLVSSRGNHSVKRYDGETGQYLGDFVPEAGGGLSLTQEVLIGPDGHFYVSGRGNNAILKYDRRSGEFLGTFTTGYVLAEPTKMTYGPDGDLYVSQWAGPQTVARFDGSTGAFVREVTPTLSQPMQQAWSGDGTLFVVSFQSKDVRRFGDDGALIDIFTSGTNLLGPVNLWFDGLGDLLVIDWEAGSVKRYDAGTGVYKSDFVTGLRNAEGYAYGPDGRLYIGDWGANEVNAYNASTGVFEETFISGGGLLNPNSILFFERLPDYGLSLSASSVTAGPGQPGQVEVFVNPDRDLAFDDAVTLSCDGLSDLATCEFSPESVVPGQAGASSALTVTVSAQSDANAAVGLGGVIAILLTVVAGRSIINVEWERVRARRRVALIASGFVLLTGGACSDSGMPDTGTDTFQTVSMTVSATSGSLVRTVSVPVRINR